MRSRTQKEKNILLLDKSYTSTRGIYLEKFIDFKDEAIIQCEVPVIENTFVSRWLQINDKNNK